VITHQRGVRSLFEALRLPLTTTKAPELAELPVTRIGIGISTFRPSDPVVVESAQLTGVDAFEEVVNVDDIASLADPLKNRLTEIARQHLPAVAAS
jgi:hypothetical protein